MTVLHVAARRGYTQVVEYLVEKGAKIEVKNRSKVSGYILGVPYEHVL